MSNAVIVAAARTPVGKFGFAEQDDESGTREPSL